MIDELWVAYGYYFVLPLEDPYILHILQTTDLQPVSNGHYLYT